MRKHQVHVLLTGGTFLSKQSTAGLTPGADTNELSEEFMQLQKILCAPFTEIVEFTFRQIMNKDSSVMLPSDWVIMSLAIHKAFMDGADAVIVVHGTDTMEYSAGAMGHTFCGDIHGRNLLTGPVIFTGAMRSLFVHGTDAIKNFQDSVSVAIWGKENNKGDVFVVFDSKIIPGVRVSKINPHAFDAFAAPALSDDASDTMNSEGVRIIYPGRYRNAARILEPQPPTLVFKPGPVMLSINPFTTPEQLLEIGSLPSIGGLVLMTPGDGNFPPHLHKASRKITRELNKPVVIVSAHDGCLVRLDAYAVGILAITEGGVTAGGDITHTQALMKMALLLQLHQPLWGTKESFVNRCWPIPMVGEISPMVAAA